MSYSFQYTLFNINKILNNSIILLISILILSGCSIKKIALNTIANSITEGSSSVFASDDDPELVAQALPFTLKTLEALHQATPDHQNLLVATAAGFVQYGHAFVLRPAEKIEKIDLKKSRYEKARAKKIFIRARDYGLKALELRYPGISGNLKKDPIKALSSIKKEDVPTLYWTGAAWGSAISVGKNDMSLIGDLPIMEALMERAMALDESWDKGTLHEFFISWDGSRSEMEGGGTAKAEKHFKRAMELNKGRSIGPFISLAESVCVREQDCNRFRELLNRALEFDVDLYPQNRLANILAQQRAEWLLGEIEVYFLD